MNSTLFNNFIVQDTLQVIELSGLFVALLDLRFLIAATRLTEWAEDRVDRLLKLALRGGAFDPEGGRWPAHTAPTSFFIGATVLLGAVDWNLLNHAPIKGINLTFPIMMLSTFFLLSLTICCDRIFHGRALAGLGFLVALLSLLANRSLGGLPC